MSFKIDNASLGKAVSSTLVKTSDKLARNSENLVQPQNYLQITNYNRYMGTRNVDAGHKTDFFDLFNYLAENRRFSGFSSAYGRLNNIVESTSIKNITKMLDIFSNNFHICKDLLLGRIKMHNKIGNKVFIDKLLPKSVEDFINPNSVPGFVIRKFDMLEKPQSVEFGVFNTKVEISKTAKELVASIVDDGRVKFETFDYNRNPMASTFMSAEDMEKQVPDLKKLLDFTSDRKLVFER